MAPKNTARKAKHLRKPKKLPKTLPLEHNKGGWR